MPHDTPGSEHRLRLERIVPGPEILCRGTKQARWRCATWLSTLPGDCRSCPLRSNTLRFHRGPRQRAPAGDLSSWADFLHAKPPGKAGIVSFRARAIERFANATLGNRLTCFMRGGCCRWMHWNHGRSMIDRPNAKRGHPSLLLVTMTLLYANAWPSPCQRGFDVTTALTEEAASAGTESPPNIPCRLRLPTSVLTHFDLIAPPPTRSVFHRDTGTLARP